MLINYTRDPQRHLMIMNNNKLFIQSIFLSYVIIITPKKNHFDRLHHMKIEKKGSKHFFFVLYGASSLPLKWKQNHNNPSFHTRFFFITFYIFSFKVFTTDITSQMAGSSSPSSFSYDTIANWLKRELWKREYKEKSADRWDQWRDIKLLLLVGLQLEIPASGTRRDDWSQRLSSSPSSYISILFVKELSADPSVIEL